jgi:signal transduction histidine kinase
MSRNVFIFILSFLLCWNVASAQESQKSSLHERAEAASAKNDIAQARSSYIRAFEDYAGKGQMKQAVECGVKATQLYYKENYYKEAFDLLRLVEQNIEAHAGGADKAALRYYTTKERLQMYMKLRKSANAQEQLNTMERYASATSDEQVKNDLLYTKAIYYYTFGMNEKGNAVFREMVGKLTTTKDYDKVDEVYQTLITSGRRSGSASMVAQAYSGYIAWKDSINALKVADEINALKQQIAQGEADIQERDSSLKARQRIIIGLIVLAVALAAVLVVGALLLLRFIILTRKQRKTIRRANENNALKARFISNISAQLSPTLKRLNTAQPEVRALLDFSEHIQTLSQLDATMEEPVEFEDTQLPPFCKGIMEQVKDKMRSGVTLTVDAPNMSAKINKEYVTHILLHLLGNAAVYTPADGHVWLEYKKRSAHKHQFLVTNTGSHIPEEKHEDVFKPFLEIHDLTIGDGLGLPICQQMAVKMGGELTIDPEFTKGTRFILTLHI